MSEDFDQAGGDDANHPDNDIANFGQLKNKFCYQVVNSNFDVLLNETENLDVYLAGAVEGSGAIGPGGNVFSDETITIGIGFKRKSNPTC